MPTVALSRGVGIWHRTLSVSAHRPQSQELPVLKTFTQAAGVTSSERRAPLRLAKNHSTKALTPAEKAVTTMMPTIVAKSCSVVMLTSTSRSSSALSRSSEDHRHVVEIGP